MSDEGADLPTDPADMKKAIEVRRQAVRIMMAEISVLSEGLRQIVGPVEWLRYMTESVQSGKSDIFGVARERQANQ